MPPLQIIDILMGANPCCFKGPRRDEKASFHPRGYSVEIHALGDVRDILPFRRPAAELRDRDPGGLHAVQGPAGQVQAVLVRAGGARDGGRIPAPHQPVQGLNLLLFFLCDTECL